MVWHDRFQRSHDVVRFLCSVANATVNPKKVIFLDGATIHSAKRVKEAAAELGLRLIFNIAHTPMYNGIEFLWGAMKKKFRTLMAVPGAQQQKHDLERIIHNIVDEIPDETKRRLCFKGWRNLFRGTFYMG